MIAEMTGAGPMSGSAQPSGGLSAKILVATPAGGSAVDVEYLSSIFQLQRDLNRVQPNIELDLVTISISDLPVARNILAHRFVSERKFSHILFIDADTGFSTNLILRMIYFNKPFLGVFYPSRSFSLDAFRRVSALEPEDNLAAGLAQNYVCADTIISDHITETGQRAYSLEAGAFVRAQAVGTGLMMLQRSVFSRIAEHAPDVMLSGSDTYGKCGITEPVGQYFASVRDKSGEYLAEDVSFCRRWTAAGGEIWACVTEPTQHVGRFVHRGAYIDRMRRGLLQIKEA